MVHFQRSIVSLIALCLVFDLNNHCSAQTIGTLDPGPIQSRQLDHALMEIAPMVEQAIQDKKMPGAVILIGFQDRIVYHRAFGHRQLQPTPLPMELDTVFDLASLTKPIATATATMMLVQRGQIELDDPVMDHIPEFAVHGKEHITIRHLLIHTSGLIPDNSMSDYAGSQSEIVQKLFEQKLNYPTDSKFRYSDVGFQILGELVRRKSGLNVADFSQQNIFAPLHMQDTGFLPPEPIRKRCATTERRDGEWMIGQVHDPRAFAMNGVAGHAGLFSTAKDLSLFARMILSEGSLDGTQILTPQTIEQMTSPYPVPNGIRGLGWDKRSDFSSNRGKTMTDSAIGHGGFTGTGIWIDPDLQMYVIFLSNRVHPDGKGSVNPLIGQIGTIAASAVAIAKQETRPKD